MKAKFIKRLKGGYKYGKKENDLLVYEYRGHEYMIEDIPPYKQEAWYFKNEHWAEQTRIDKIIESENRQNNDKKECISVDEAIDELMKLWEE